MNEWQWMIWELAYQLRDQCHIKNCEIKVGQKINLHMFCNFENWWISYAIYGRTKKGLTKLKCFLLKKNWPGLQKVTDGNSTSLMGTAVDLIVVNTGRVFQSRIIPTLQYIPVRTNRNTTVKYNNSFWVIYCQL